MSEREPLIGFKTMFEKAPDTKDAMKRYKVGKAGFTDIAHLKAKGLIARYKLAGQIFLGIFVSVMIIYNIEEQNVFLSKYDIDEIGLNNKDIIDYIDSEFKVSNTEISVPFSADKRVLSVDKIKQQIEGSISSGEMVVSSMVLIDSLEYWFPQNVIRIFFL